MGQTNRNRRGPAPGTKKRDFDVYVDNADDAGFEIPRSDIRSKHDRVLDPINGPALQSSVIQQVVLQEITAFCNEHVDGMKQKTIDQWCRVEPRTSRRWRQGEFTTVSEAVAFGAIDRHPRADNARKTTDNDGKALYTFTADGSYEDCAQPWRYIGAAIGIKPRAEGGPTERTIRKLAHLHGVHDRVTVRKKEVEDRVAQMRKRTANYILGFDADDVFFLQLRCSDESHEGLIKWAHDHQKRPNGYRDDPKKIQRDPPRSKRQKASRKGKQADGRQLLDMEPRGPINGNAQLRELVEQAVHWWGCVGVNHKSELYFYDKNSNGKMDSDTYEAILRWYDEKYPRGQPGTAEDYILVEDRDGAHGTHGYGVQDEPFDVQTGDQWKSKKGYNRMTQVKHSLNMRWLVLPTGACDLNVVENCWQLLEQRLPSLQGLTKVEKQEIIQQTWRDKVRQSEINELFLGSRRKVSLRQRFVETEEVYGQMTVH